MATLSLCLIAKNEESNLKRCLEGVRGVFDEIILVDTGSTDKTKEVALLFGAKVYDFQWIDDFSAARNFSFSKAVSQYTMWLDCDDEILPDDREKLLKIKQNLSADAYLMRYNYAPDEYGREIIRFYRHRIVRNSGEVKWHWPIHECMVIPENWKQEKTDIVVTHRRSAEDYAVDSDRDLQMLGKAIEKEPSPRMLFYYARELYNRNRFEEAEKYFLEYFKRGGDWVGNVVNAYYCLALSYWQMTPSNSKNVIKACLDGIGVNPQRAEFYNLVGQLHFDRGDWRRSIRWFEMASHCSLPDTEGDVLLSEYLLRPYDMLAKCYAEVGMFKEAYEANSKALQYDPLDQRILSNQKRLEAILFGGENQPQKEYIKSSEVNTMTGRPTLSLCLIVRDEESNLKRCFESVQGVFDEIVVVDTGSKDKTKEVAASFGAKIFDFRWIDDFAAARNFSFSKATSSYVMWVDADDILKEEDKKKLLELRNNLTADAYLMVYNYAPDERGNPKVKFYRHRIVRNNGQIKWRWPIHECMDIPGGWSQVKTDIVITHVRSAQDSTSDSGRNLRMLERAVKTDPCQRMRYYYAKELYFHGKLYEAEREFVKYLKHDDWIDNLIDAHYYLALTYWSLDPKKYQEEIINTCFKGIRVDPRRAEFYNIIGQIYYNEGIAGNRGSWDKAKAWFEMSVSYPIPETVGSVPMDEYTWKPHDRLCKCYSELGMLGEACRENEIALGFLPNDQRLIANHQLLKNILNKEKPINDGYDTPSISVQAVQVGQKLKVRWLMPPQLNENYPALRIRCRNVNNWLKANGIDSDYYTYQATAFEDLRLADVVVVSMYDEALKKLLGRLRNCGVAIIYDVCEDVADTQTRSDCFSLANRIVCCSTVLAEKLKSHGVTTTIVDAYETIEGYSHSYEPHAKDGKLRVAWCGCGGNLETLDQLRPIISRLGMELVTISEWDTADIKWNQDTWLNDLGNSDIVVCPQRHWIQPAKSNTKATQAMILGLPVVASPLQSYREAIIHGQTGFICEASEDWEKNLTILKDKAVREKVGSTAQIAVVAYSIGTVGRLWKRLFDEVISENHLLPKVDIIIPTWNNLPYLKECIKSIEANTDCPYNIIVINSGTDETAAWLASQPKIIHYNAPQRLHFSAANNIGLNISKERYICLLNDDTIVAKGWLSAMMAEAMKPDIGAVNPFSNCDKGWVHNESVVIDGVDLVPTMKLEQVQHIIPKIYEYRHPKVVLEREWVAFYATLIPRAVIDKIGLLDEEYKSGCEDLDYCMKIKEAGYRTVHTFDSFVFHFGGKTRKKAEDANFEQHHKEDAENQAIFKRKHSKQLFVLYTGAAWERWSPKNVDQGGIGGSETCAVFLAREFSKRGYEAHVFSDCGDMEGVYDGVQYHKYDQFPQFVSQRYINLFVSSRLTDVFDLPIKAGRKVCWVHDIWLHPDRNASINRDKIDKFICLSPWHRDFFCGHHNIPPSQVCIVRDGIDLNRFNQSQKREKGRIIYSSSPDRGLDVLLTVFPRIRQAVPHATLHVYYGFNNWEKAVVARNNPDEVRRLQYIKQLLNQPGVTFHGRVGQQELALEFLKSELWAYPTYFTETFCITAAEAMASGLPIVTSNLAALNTTVGDAGIILNGDPCSVEYQSRFAEACINILKNPNVWKVASEKSKGKASQFTWSTIVDEWLGQLK